MACGASRTDWNAEAVPIEGDSAWPTAGEDATVLDVGVEAVAVAVVDVVDVVVVVVVVAGGAGADADAAGEAEASAAHRMSDSRGSFAVEAAANITGWGDPAREKIQSRPESWTEGCKGGRDGAAFVQWSSCPILLPTCQSAFLVYSSRPLTADARTRAGVLRSRGWKPVGSIRAPGVEALRGWLAVGGQANLRIW